VTERAVRTVTTSREAAVRAGAAPVALTQLWTTGRQRRCPVPSAAGITAASDRLAAGWASGRLGGLLDEHHRDPVADRVAPAAGGAHDRVPTLLVLDRAVAGGADEDLEEPVVDGHDGAFLASGG
jgi:hypothetical protein